MKKKSNCYGLLIQKERVSAAPPRPRPKLYSAFLCHASFRSGFLFDDPQSQPEEKSREIETTATGRVNSELLQLTVAEFHTRGGGGRVAVAGRLQHCAAMGEGARVRLADDVSTTRSRQRSDATRQRIGDRQRQTSQVSHQKPLFSTNAIYSQDCRAPTRPP